jgi:hypothetical protein
MVPPSNRRKARARSMKSRGPTIIEPTGALSPFDTQKLTEQPLLQHVQAHCAALPRHAEGKKSGDDRYAAELGAKNVG